MDWIKKNYDQLALSVVSLLLLGMSAWLYLNAKHFDETFASIRGQVLHNDKVAQIDTSSIDLARNDLAKPAAWESHPGSLFVSDKYIVKEARLIDPRKSEDMLHPPVPNAWFFENNLDILQTGILTGDTDGDGFNNLEEFQAKTDPQNKEVHPSYLTKLRLVRAIRKPFRLLFNAYEGDPAKPESMTFQINTVDIRQPSQFLKVGDKIAQTKFKIVNFEVKKVTNPSTGVDQDVSELTVENGETGDKVVLVKEKITDSPDSYALFKFLWDGSQFPVKKGKTFSLKPEPDVVFNLIDISDSEALIESTKTGEKIKVPKLEAP